MKKMMSWLFLMFLAGALSSCSAAALKNGYTKEVRPDEYQAPSHERVTHITVTKSDTPTKGTSEKQSREIKVTKVGDKFIVTVEEK